MALQTRVAFERVIDPLRRPAPRFETRAESLPRAGFLVCTESQES